MLSVFMELVCLSTSFCAFEGLPSNVSHILQFLREYTGKVDELIKDKLEALTEVKAKEKEEKDIMAQQVFALSTLFIFVMFPSFFFSHFIHALIAFDCSKIYLNLVL